MSEGLFITLEGGEGAGKTTQIDLKLVFPKGEKAEEEVSLARQKWAFDLEKHPSRTEGKAHILVLKQVRRLPARCA